MRWRFGEGLIVVYERSLGQALLQVHYQKYWCDEFCKPQWIILLNGFPLTWVQTSIESDPQGTALSYANLMLTLAPLITTNSASN